MRKMYTTVATTIIIGLVSFGAFAMKSDMGEPQIIDMNPWIQKTAADVGAQLAKNGSAIFCSGMAQLSNEVIKQLNEQVNVLPLNGPRSTVEYCVIVNKK